MSCVRLDPHSYADSDQPQTRAIDLALRADFQHRTLEGEVTLRFGEPGGGAIDLETRELRIEAVTALEGAPLRYELAAGDPILGARLRVNLPDGARGLRIRYATSPTASALQWLEPPQTAGKEPFLFSQCQPIHARSLAPLQDTPRIRVTVGRARFRVPSRLRTLMAAAAKGREDAGGGEAVDVFEMPQPIPPYLLAFAVGDLQQRELSARTAVWAERAVVDAAAYEFAGAEEMIRAAEQLFGPYEWDRYDILVMPPSFPYGGMENPRLTFVTPSVLVGDRSLVSVIAHEAAHAWTGNLVTNANANHFWLNEGFTVYAERRILEFLETELPGVAARAGALEYIDGPGVPGDAPQPGTPRLDQLRRGEVEPRNPTELLVVLQSTPADAAKLRELDARWGLSQRRSLELRHSFVLLQIRAGMPGAVDAARRVLLETGRMRYLRPLYTALARRDPAEARRIYEEARAGYHSIARTVVEALLKEQGA